MYITIAVLSITIMLFISIQIKPFKININTLFIYLAIISSIWSQNIIAQDLYYITHLDITKGLSNNKIDNIVMDRNGYIWIGTSVGINRYDGYDFKLYLENKDNPWSLKGTNIDGLHIDKKGNLWVATKEGGVNLYVPENDGFISEFNTKGLLESYPNIDDFLNYRAKIIFSDEKNRILIGSGYYTRIIEYKNDTIYELFNTKIYHFAKYINNCTLDNKKRFWIASRSGMICIDSSLNVIYKAKDDSIQEPFENNWFNTCFFDSQNNLWLSSNVYGIQIYNPDKQKFVNPYTLKLTTKKDFLLDIKPVTITEDHNGNIWLGLSTTLIRYNYTQRKFDTITNLLGPGQQLSDNSITSLLVDKFNNLWVGTYHGGVNVIYKQKSNFELYQHYEFMNSISNNTVTCFAEDNNGMIWIGHNKTSFDVFDPKTRQFKNFYFTDFPPIEKIHSLGFQSPNKLWIGSNKGLFLFNTNTKSMSPFYSTVNAKFTGGRKIGQVAFILKENKDNIITSFRKYGIYCFNTNTNEIKKFSDYIGIDTTLFDDRVVNRIVKDKNNNYWLCDAHGLFYCDVHNKTITWINHILENDSINSVNDVRDVYLAKNRKIWAAISTGLGEVDIDKQLIYPRIVTVQNRSIEVLKIQPDRNDDLWLTTNNGIIKYFVENDSIIRYAEEDGLQSLHFLRNASLLSKSGKYYVGGVNGFNIFDFEHVKIDTVYPVVNFNSIHIRSKKRLFKITESLEFKYPKNGETIKLKHYHNNFSIDFIGITMPSSEYNIYKYYLKNFDHDWIECGKERKATYTNISPGKYTFYFNAANRDGLWSKEDAYINIIISPPFWNTWWFKIIIFIAISGIILSIYFYRIYILKQRQRLLEKMVKEKTSELLETNKNLEESKKFIEEQSEEIKQTNENLEEVNAILTEKQVEIKEQADELRRMNSTKDKLFSIIAHDLKNPFNSILGQSELLQKRIDDYSKEKIQLQARNINLASSQAFNLLENLLQWSRGQAGTIVHEPTNIYLTPIIDDIIELAQQNADKKEISLSSKIDNKIKVYADQNMLKTVLRNLLSNAIKYTNKRGKIELKAEIDDGYTKISVQDNGIGIAKKDIKKLFKVDTHHSTKGTDGESGTGLGLLLCKEFIEKNGGKIWVQSEINKGSIFIFTLPIEKI